MHIPIFFLSILALASAPGARGQSPVLPDNGPKEWVDLQAVAPDGVETPVILKTPEGTGPFPVVVFFHGAPGGQGIDAMRQIATRAPSSIRWDRFLQEGWAVAVADYRGHPPNQPFTVLQGEINAADDAIAVLNLLKEYRFLDASRVAMMGGSLGGAVVLEAIQRAPVAAVVLNAPATFPFLDYRGEPLGSGCEPPLSDGSIDRQGALSRIGRIHNPVLIAQGTADGLCRLNRKLHELMKEAGILADLKLYEGQTHGFTNGPDTPAFRQAIEDTVTFLRAQLKAAPTGLYCSCPPTSARSHSVMPQVAALQFVTGILVRVSWRDIEPQDGEFDWSLIDGELDLARQAGKLVSLAVLNGPAAPDWLAAKGAQMFEYTLRDSPRRMPHPWDPVYLEAWQRFVGRLGERYRQHPQLALVHVTHSTANGFEMQLTLSPQDQQRWSDAGYTPEKLVDSWQQTLDAFGNAFPDTPLDVDVHPVLGSDRIAQEVVAYGRQRIGRRFGTLAAWWSQKNASVYPGMYELLLQAARDSFATVQSAGSYTLTPDRLGEGGLARSISLALESGVCYLEIWNSDLLNPELAPMLKETSDGLAAAGSAAAFTAPAGARPAQAGVGHNVRIQ